MNHQMKLNKPQNLKLNQIFTIAKAVELSNFPMRTLYRRIERGEITPIVFADKFFLDKKTVNKLRREVSSIGNQLSDLSTRSE